MTTPTFSDPGEASRFAQYKAAQTEEYGTYIAAGEITVGSARAFNAGYPVPKSTAEAMGWHLDGTCVPAGTALPTPATTAAEQVERLKARREEMARATAALDAELAAMEAPVSPNYSAMTVIALKDELATRELSTSGLKDELIARLQADDEVEA